MPRSPTSSSDEAVLGDDAYVLSSSTEICIASDTGSAFDTAEVSRSFNIVSTTDSSDSRKQAAKPPKKYFMVDRIVSAGICSLGSFALITLMLYGIYEMLVAMYLQQQQPLGLMIGLILVVFVGGGLSAAGCFCGIQLLNDGAFKWIRCFEPGTVATISASIAAIVYIYGAGIPLFILGGDYGLFRTATLLDANLDHMVTDGDGGFDTSHLGFIFDDAQLGDSHGIVAAAHGSVLCGADVCGRYKQCSCNRTACVTPVWSPRSQKAWNLRILSDSLSFRVIAAYAVCFLDSAVVDTFPDLESACMQNCGDQSANPVEALNDDCTFTSVAESRPYGVNWAWLDDNPDRVGQGWRQYIGTTEDTTKHLLLEAAANLLEQKYNVTSLKDSNGSPIFLFWGAFPIPVMQRAGDVLIIVLPIFAAVAFVIDLTVFLRQFKRY